MGTHRRDLRTLLAAPPYRWWLAASQLARLPMTMTLLALVLAGEASTGFLATGAQLAGVATLATGAAAPFRGAQLDRGDLRRGLCRDLAVTAAVLAAQATAVGAGAPLGVLVLLAALQGVAYGGATGGYRALMGHAVPRGAMEVANNLDAVLTELGFVAGPALAGVLAFVVGPVGVLVAMASLAAGAALVTPRLLGIEDEVPKPSADAPDDARDDARDDAVDEVAATSPWRLPTVRVVYALAVLAGAALGILEASVPALLELLGREPAGAGFLLVLTAVGSAAGGLVQSAQRGVDAARRAPVLLVASGLLLLPVALAGSRLALAAALLAAGFPLAPVNALGLGVLQRDLPVRRRAQGFAIYTAAILVGAGAGQALFGLLLPAWGPRWPVAVAVGAQVAGGLAVAAGVRRAAMRDREDPCNPVLGRGVEGTDARRRGARELDVRGAEGRS